MDIEQSFHRQQSLINIDGSLVKPFISFLPSILSLFAQFFLSFTHLRVPNRAFAMFLHGDDDDDKCGAYICVCVRICVTMLSH